VEGGGGVGSGAPDGVGGVAREESAVAEDFAVADGGATYLMAMILPLILRDSVAEGLPWAKMGAAERARAIRARGMNWGRDF
jgi:hypothetical protein